MPFCANRSARRAAPRRAHLLPLLALAALDLSACKQSAADGPAPVAAAVTVQGGNNQTGPAGQALATELSVLVTDVNNNPISGRRVDWDISAGAGSLSPRSSTTNARGIATSVWTVGPVAGTARVTAQVNGVNPAVFNAIVIAGAPASVVGTPEAGFLGVGDTLRVRASVRDAFGNTIAGQVVNFTSLDAGVATVSGTGLVTALTQGTARIVADAAGRADTVPVSIGAPGTSFCGATAPVAMALGEVQTPVAGTTSVGTCLTAPGPVNAEYALVFVNTSTNFGIGTFIDVLGLGNTGNTIGAITASPLGDASPFTSPFTVDVLPTGGAIADRDEERAAELARREVERRELTPLVNDARTWYANRPRLTSLVAVPRIGDEIKLNANANQACSSPSTRTGRVAAISPRAMIVTDIENPAGGYTDAEYAGILATFDTLVFPMDTAAFGAPTNISQYGRLILFYTKAVNELTPRNATFTIGGFFFSRDLYPRKAANGLAGCSASNENEMFYLLVPDPNGEVNGNRRTKDEVTRGNLAAIAHELQHLINASRRLYVNAGAAASEETWLDEGLSHVAEELLYFRIAGYGARQNLTLQDVSATSTRQTEFNTYASLNFFRFQRYLSAPETNSPVAPNDSLATRGATWNFLRFAGARQGAGNEAAFFRALVNARTTGVTNLQSVLTTGGFGDYLLGWTVSLVADDFSAATTAALEARFQNPAWNFRSIYPGLRTSSGTVLGTYPIAARSLTSSNPQRIVLSGGTSSFVRFGIQAGRTAFVSFSTNGQLPPASIRWALVRVR